MQHRRVRDVVIGILLPPGVQQVQTNSQNQIWRKNLIEAAKKYLFGELRVILGALWDNIAATLPNMMIVANEVAAKGGDIVFEWPSRNYSWNFGIMQHVIHSFKFYCFVLRLQG